MNKLFSVFLLTTALTSCAVGPDYTRPDTVTDKQIAASLHLENTNGKVVDTLWYKSFDDERLNALIDMTLIDNTDVGAAIERMKQARLNLQIQGVAYFPTIDLAGGYTKLKPSKNTSFSYKEDYYQAGIDASWELDIWGGGRRATESAAAGYVASVANLKNIRVSLKAEVLNNYIALRAAQEQLRLLQKYLMLAQRIVLLAQRNHRAGLIPYADLLQSRYAADAIAMQIPDIKNAVETYKNNLTLLAGKLPGQLNALTDDTTDNIVTRSYGFDLQALYLLPASCVRNRPDVQSAEQSLIAQNAAIGQAIAAMLPDLTLSGFFGFQADKLPELLKHRSHLVSLTPSLTMPLFHWGAVMRHVETQKSATREAAYAYKGALLNATAEIKNAISGVLQQYIKNLAAKNALIEMEEITVQTVNKYESGLIPLSQLLTVLQNRLNAETDLVTGNGTLYQSIAAFYKSVGT